MIVTVQRVEYKIPPTSICPHVIYINHAMPFFAEQFHEVLFHAHIESSLTKSHAVTSRLLSTRSLWSRITNNPDCSTGPLVHMFACSLALLTHLLVQPARFARVLHCAHSFYSLPPSWVGEFIQWLFFLFFFVFGPLWRSKVQFS